MTKGLAVMVVCAALFGPAPARAESCNKSCAPGTPRSARGCCIGKPKKAAAPKGELRERQVSLPDLPVEGDIVAPAADFRPDPAARAALPTRDLGAEVDEAMAPEYERGAKLPDSDPDKPTYLLLLADVRAAQYRKARAAKEATAGDRLVAAVSLYSGLTSNAAFARFPKLGDAVARLALLLQESGQPDKALLLFRRLVKEFPRSSYLADAYLWLGEHEFYAGNLAAADAFYQKLLPRTQAPVYPYVRYMSGWILFNQAKASEAFAAWREVATRAAALGQTALAKAAADDAVRAYASFGTAAGARTTFTELAPKRVTELLDRLGEVYLQDGRFAAAIEIYRGLLSAEPKSARQCAWLVYVAQATVASGSGEERVQALVSLGKQLTVIERTKRLAGKPLAVCQADVEKILRDAAFAWHHEGDKTRDPARLAVAATLYEAYEKAFPVSAQGGEVRYFHAELLWSLAQIGSAPDAWRAAAKAYGRALAMKSLGAGRRKEAAYAGVLAWKQVVAKDVKPGGDAPEAAPSEDEEDFMRAIDSYLAYDSASADAQALRFLQARIHERRGRVPEAISVLSAIVTEHPDDEVAPFAVQILLDLFNRSGQIDELVRWTEELATEPRYAGLKSALGDLVPRLRSQVQRKKAETLAEAGKYAECAKTYLDLAAAAPADPLGDQLLYNAMVCSLQAGDRSAASAAVATLKKRFPKSPLGAKAQERLAKP